jgi:hypothetical protein
MRSDERNDLDRILDEALSSYSQQEPAPGLQGRILRRTAAVEDRRKGLFIRWAFATAAAACLVMLVISQRSDRISTASVPAARVTSDVRQSPNEFAPTFAAPEIPTEPVVRESVRRSLPTPQAATPLPQPQQFPTPLPLSDEERALLALFKSASKSAVDGLQPADAQVLPEPIRIAAIEIRPLEEETLR